MTPPALAHELVERDGAHDRLLVLLHGYGEPASDLRDRLHLIDPDGRFLAVVPEAPFERKGRAIWHRALSVPDEAEEQFRASTAALDALLGELGDETGLDPAHAVVGGFSQGGGLALGLLLGADVRHRPAAGFGVCSFPPPVRGLRVDRRAAMGRPYFLSSARQDHFAPIEASRSGAVLLRDTGLDLTYVETDGAHEMTDDAARSIGTWLEGLDRGEPVTGSDLLAGVSPRSDLYDALWELVT
ncbi:MAG: alpha/beta hydrolase [Aquihabitans sp.]